MLWGQREQQDCRGLWRVRAAVCAQRGEAAGLEPAGLEPGPGLEGSPCRSPPVPSAGLGWSPCEACAVLRVSA